MRNIYTSVDIGSDSIKVTVLEYYHDKYNVLAKSTVKSSGVKLGLIVDASAVSNAIKKAIKNVENKLGTKIVEVVATVPSNNLELTMVSATVNITKEIVSGDDIYRCMQLSLKNSISPGIELVTISPVEYKLDDKVVINPIGKTAKTLSVKAIAAFVPKKNVYSVVSALNSVNVEVIDILFNSVANYYSIKNKELDSKVVGLIDIGKDKTTASVFNKGVLIKEVVLPLGGSNLDLEIATKYNIEEELAKHIKETFAIANRKYADGDEEYPALTKDKEKIKINQYHLAELIESRVVDMLKNIKNELIGLTKKEIGYIIITGEISSMLGFNAIVEELFIRNANVINLGIIGIRENKYASCYGTIKYFKEKLSLREKEYTMFSEEKVDEMLSTRKKFGTSNVLGKIFEKIFD